MLTERIPLKQGLKQHEFASRYGLPSAHRANSTKTRIETILLLLVVNNPSSSQSEFH